MSDDAPASRSVPWDPATDLLVLFTDGITEALDAEGRPMGEQRILETIVANHHEPPATIVERVFEALRDHTGDVPPRDDLTLVVLRN
jgi:sigma-B regulation protein RsbU (phosphoserine phosphatase)